MKIKDMVDDVTTNLIGMKMLLATLDNDALQEFVNDLDDTLVNEVENNLAVFSKNNTVNYTATLISVQNTYESEGIDEAGIIKGLSQIKQMVAAMDTELKLDGEVTISTIFIKSMKLLITGFIDTFKEDMPSEWSTRFYKIVNTI